MNKKMNFDIEKKPLAKPFLKWAGGKTQLLPVFENCYPEELKNHKIRYYYEPFLGGGAVLFNILQAYPQIEHAFAYEINEEIVIIYNIIKTHPEELIEELTRIRGVYLSNSSEKKREAFYYQIRDDFNHQKTEKTNISTLQDKIVRAAWLIFLNKTCFNGLYRVNKKGHFNVPFGRYPNPQIFDEENIFACSEVLKKVKIKHCDYLEIRKDIKENSFVYFDPPYRPISRTSNFTSYSKYEFDDIKQIELSDIFKELSKKKGVKLMLSNSDPKNTNEKDNFFQDHFRQSGIFISSVPAKRMINSKAVSRGSISELVITNYRIGKNVCD